LGAKKISHLTKKLSDFADVSNYSYTTKTNVTRALSHDNYRTP